MSDTIEVTCPKTGEKVPTGIAGGPNVQMEGNSFRCSACGEEHTWDKPAGEAEATVRD